jgi:hypothetical protein
MTANVFAERRGCSCLDFALYLPRERSSELLAVVSDDQDSERLENWMPYNPRLGSCGNSSLPRFCVVPGSHHVSSIELHNNVKNVTGLQFLNLTSNLTKQRGYAICRMCDREVIALPPARNAHLIGLASWMKICAKHG